MTTAKEWGGLAGVAESESVAFVLSGGGSHGAIQAGMLTALAERGVTADLVVGSSVGAINAAWYAGSPTLDGARELESIWLGLKRRDIFPLHPVVGLRGFLGRDDHLVPARRFRDFLAGRLPYRTIEDAAVALRVVATDADTGSEVVLDSGDVVDAVSASAAIPGVFPSVRIGGRRLIDGGVSNNTPIAHAQPGGARTVYVLSSGYACDLTHHRHGALSAALQSVTMMVQQRLAVDVARWGEDADLRVIPTLCPLRISPHDFSHTAELIGRGHDVAAEWLDTGQADGAASPLPHAHA